MNFEKSPLSQDPFHPQNERISSVNRTSIIKTQEEKEIVRTEIFESTTDNAEDLLKPAFTVVTECTRRSINNLNNSLGKDILSSSMEQKNRKVTINDKINNISSSIFEKNDNNFSNVLNKPEIKKVSNVIAQSKNDEKNLQKLKIQKRDIGQKDNNKSQNNKSTNINNNNPNNLKNNKNVSKQNRTQIKSNIVVNKNNISSKNNINYNVHNQRQKSTSLNNVNKQISKSNITNNNINKNKVTDNIVRKKVTSVDKPAKIIESKAKKNLLNTVLNKSININPIHPNRKKNLSQDRNSIKSNTINEIDIINEEKESPAINEINIQELSKINVNNNLNPSNPIYSVNKISSNNNINKNDTLTSVEEGSTNDIELKNQNDVQKVTLKSLVNPNKNIKIQFTKNSKVQKPIKNIETKINVNNSKNNVILHSVASNEISFEEEISLLKKVINRDTFKNDFEKFLLRNNITINSLIPFTNNEKSMKFLEYSKFWEKYIFYLSLVNNDITLYNLIHIIEQYYIWCKDMKDSQFKEMFINLLDNKFSKNEIKLFLMMNRTSNLNDIFKKFENYECSNEKKEIKLDNNYCDKHKNDDDCRLKMVEINKNRVNEINIGNIFIKNSYDTKEAEKSNLIEKFKSNNIFDYIIQFSYKPNHKINQKEPLLFSASKIHESSEINYGYNAIDNIKKKEEKEEEKEKEEDKKEEKEKEEKEKEDKKEEKEKEDKEERDKNEEKEEKEEDIEKNNKNKRKKSKKKKSKKKNITKSYKNSDDEESKEEEEKEKDRHSNQNSSIDLDDEEAKAYPKKKRRKKSVKKKSKSKRNKSKEIESEDEEENKNKNKINRKYPKNSDGEDSEEGKKSKKTFPSVRTKHRKNKGK